MAGAHRREPGLDRLGVEYRRRLFDPRLLRRLRHETLARLPGEEHAADDDRQQGRRRERVEHRPADDGAARREGDGRGPHGRRRLDPERCVEPVHEARQVAGRRRRNIGTLRERLTNDSQILDRGPALRAAGEMPGDLRVRRLVELAVEIEFDRSRVVNGAVRHAPSPAVTFATVNACRRRWTAACSCRFTVPSANPSALAISHNFSP